jgi:hypothetical protein
MALGVGSVVLALLGAWWLARPLARGGAPEQVAAPRARALDDSAETPQAPRGEAPAPAPDSVPEAEGGVDVELLAAGRGVPGAEVRLYRRGARDFNLGTLTWSEPVTGVTDARGGARLAAGPGHYVVAVRVAGQAPRVREVERPRGQPWTRVRLTLEPGQTLVGRTVVRATGEPLPLVQLSLLPRAEPGEFGRVIEVPEAERPQATSDPRGGFRLDGLAPGDYRLEAEATGYARTELEHVRVPTREPLEVALRPAGVLEGFVVDARGQPAAQAEVLVSGLKAQQLTTGEGGGFSVELEPGTYGVSARRGEEAAALEDPLVLSAGRTVRGVRLVLGPGATLEGHVGARGSGAPVAGARVDVSPLGRNGDLGRVTTDAEGRFLLGGLPPGGYDVVARAPGFTPLLRRGVMVGARERFTLELRLEATGTVEGRVLDTQGQPVMGIRVLAQPRQDALEEQAVEARTDAEGHYQLEGLRSGPNLISARRDGAQRGESVWVEVSERETPPQDFTLRDTGTVLGVVRGARPGPGKEPLQVIALASSPSAAGIRDSAQAPVEPDGDFQLVLPAGDYTLVMRPFSSLPGVPVHVEPGATARVELRWEERDPGAVRLRGTVVEPDGTPSPRATVLVSEEGTEGSGAGAGSGSGSDEALRGGGFADEDGAFDIELFGLEADTPRLRVRALSGGRQGRVAGVRPGEGSVRIRLEPGASLRGRVVGTGGPVHGFTLALEGEGLRWRGEDRGPWQFSGERFELRDLPAGPVKVRVRTEQGTRAETEATLRAGVTADLELTLTPAEENEARPQR